ncbi:hypothetical protein [Saccharophagus degradans]|uniref:Uncharacterized protein n=1 Tax=Saccharophagus degradans TaxID=86304 RepID=A0AAW7X230_9GAMM|nr:hypothetical protein [Saccharophagus degradans]MDO6421547.1 hypothetical protein [Saccharophagus degradans]MDO6608509.1 hypothetical protein [Saccharophagus degradans]
MKKSIYIKILEFGEQCGIDGASYDSLIEWLESEEVINDKENVELVVKNRITSIFYECFEKTTGSEHNTRLLKPEYFYRLIEFRELEESRKASSDANRKSNIAILVSVVAIVATLIISFIQLNSSISIQRSQLESIIKSNSPPLVQKVTVENSQIAEIKTAINESAKSVSDQIKSTEVNVVKSLNKSIQPNAKASAD